MRTLILMLLLVPSIAVADGTKSVVPAHTMERTKNGVPIYFFSKSNVPIFEVQFVYEGGADLDPSGKSGLAFLTALLSQEGVPGFDEWQLSRRLDDLAAGIHFSVADDQVVVTAYGLTEHSSEILALMFKEIAEPTLPEASFERLKSNAIDRGEELTDSPSRLLGQTFGLLVENGTTKTRPIWGFVSDLKAISLSDVKSHRAQLFRTDKLKVLVSTSPDRQASSRLLETVRAGIEALPCPLCGKPVPRKLKWEYQRFRAAPRRLVLIDSPGLSEAHIEVGMLGPARREPLYHELRLAEAILGGSFSSRLNTSIRERMGLSYGISASFDMDRDFGVLHVSTTTATGQVVALLKALKKELKKFADGDILPDELRGAQDYLTGSFPLALQDNYVIARQFFAGILDGLDPDFLDIYISHISTVTVVGMRRAIRKYFRPDEFLTVVVGDAKTISKGLRAAGIKYEMRKATDFL